MAKMARIASFMAASLFLGATIGFNIASGALDFTSAHLVSDEKAMAKIVVGSKNPDSSGLVQDTLSATVIRDRVSERFTILDPGSFFSFEFNSEDLDDNSGTEVPGADPDDDGDDFLETDTSAVINGFSDNDYDDQWIVTELSNFGPANVIQLSDNWDIREDRLTNTERFGIWKDVDGDGAIEPDADWPVYNDIFIVDRSSSSISIIPAMRVGSIPNLEGRVFEMRGQEYLVKDFDATSVDIVSSFETALVDAGAQDLVDASVLIPGTSTKIGLTGFTNGAGAQGTIAIIEGGNIIKNERRTFEVGRDLDLFTDFFVIPTQVLPSGIRVSIGKKAGEITIADFDKNVFGYERAIVGEDGDGWTDELRFEDGTIEIPRGRAARLGESDFYFAYSDDNEIDIFFRKSVKVPLEDPKEVPLNIEIIRDADVTQEVRANYNLILMGGPVANFLTWDFVDRNWSKVDWASSHGEVEVVDDPYGFNRDVIIVAGKDRKSTRKAAEALAAQI
jgi:hypothetical protein